MCAQEQENVKQQVVELTHEMLYAYYCRNDVEALISRFDEDIVWLGAGEQEYASGVEIVSGIFRQFAGMVPKYNLSNGDYQALELAPGVYLCAGRVWIETDPSTRISLRVHQRVSLIFRMKEGMLRCCHIHISNPYGEMVEDDVGFPLKMAQQSYEYLQEQVAAQKKQIYDQTKMLERMSYEDALTGLYNRHKFNELVDNDAFALRTRLGVACFDINGLKRVNDQLGHLAGDDLLRRAAGPLLRVFGGRAFRVGGDEFVVVEHMLTETEFYDAIRSVQRGMRDNNVSCSVGVSWREENCSILKQLEEADQQMYADKKKYYRLLMREWIEQEGD